MKFPFSGKDLLIPPNRIAARLSSAQWNGWQSNAANVFSTSNEQQTFFRTATVKSKYNSVVVICCLSAWEICAGIPH